MACENVPIIWSVREGHACMYVYGVRADEKSAVQLYKLPRP